MPARDAILEAIRIAVQPLPIRAAWLFGSQADGSPRPDSDLDIAVAFDHGLDARAKEDARRSLVVALTDRLGSLGERADVVDLDLASTAIAFRAIRDGALAFESSKKERVRVMVRVMRRYDDAAPYRALARDAAERIARAMGSAHGRS